MATYRLEAKVISRAKGRSATASAAYRSGAAIEDERTGEVFDYTRKRGVVHSEIMAPANTPDWMHDRSALWNAVERIEQRCDAQLARDFLLSLPHELTHEQRVDLVREFLADEFVARGMIADFSIHTPDRRSDERNHHAHIMVTMRELTGAGFGLKNREWNKTSLLETWRERWADTVNRHLEHNGHEVRVDHRSLEDQGIDREPEPKQGPIATEMERNGKASHAGDDRRAVQARNEERAMLLRAANDIGAQLIMLDPNRPRGPAFEDVREGEVRDADVRHGDVHERDDADEQKRRIRPSFADTDGGMVAQQADAMRRFRQNSEALEARRRDAVPPEQESPSDLDAMHGKAILGPEKSENPAMTSRYDSLRSEQSKATQDKEQASQSSEAKDGSPQQQAREGEASVSQAKPERISNLSWSLDQSMPAQNAAANRWAEQSNARRQDQPRDTEGERSPDLAEPQREHEASRPQYELEQDGSGGARKKDQEKDEPEPELYFGRETSVHQRFDLKREQSERDVPEQGEGGQEKAEPELSFGRETSLHRRVDLKREQSEHDVSESKDSSREKGGPELTFRKDRERGPDLSR